jgi:Cu2+-exporting ATPase
VNRDGPLVVRVTAAGDATRLAAVLRLVEQAAEARPRVARVADRVASAFIAALLLLAIAVAIAWWNVDPTRVLPVTFALLVVSCPCALSLATPATLAAAAGALSRREVVIARADALETLARVTHVVFDKTGTLTRGGLALVAMRSFGGSGDAKALRIAAALEARSEHPLAVALRNAAGDATLGAEDIVAVSGQGMEGVVDGARYRLGRVDFVAALAGPLPPEAAAFVAGLPQSASVVALGSGAGIGAIFALGDAPREHAAEAIAALRRAGVVPLVVSGDRSATAQALGRDLHIDDARGDLSPADKRDAIRALQQAGGVVAMVGDGVNDAPGLAQAQVSISLASATPLAQWTADVVVLSDELRRIPETIVHARRTLALVRQNLGWAFAYNAVAIPAAAFGFVTPLAAALGMSISSLVVVGNALRAARGGRK